MKDLEITLPNHAGALAELSKALGAAGVNIGGISGYASNGEGVLHLLVEDANVAKKALDGTSATVNDERDVVIWKYGEKGAAGKPGSLGEISQKLAEAGVNIDLIYTGENDTVVLGVNDLEAAKNVVG